MRNVVLLVMVFILKDKWAARLLRQNIHGVL